MKKVPQERRVLEDLKDIKKERNLFSFSSNFYINCLSLFHIFVNKTFTFFENQEFISG